jgi:hypothetical protein
MASVELEREPSTSDLDEKLDHHEAEKGNNVDLSE